MSKRFTALFLAALVAGSVHAADFSAAPDDDLAQRVTALSLKQEVAASDPRVAQTRKLLDKAAKLTQETPVAVVAACSRYAGHLFDAIHEPASALELLEALAAFGKAGQPMNMTLQNYASARKAAPTKSHAEAMAALARKK